MTARRITPGRDGLSTFSSCDFRLSSLSLPEMWSWFAAQLMLSLRECELGISLGSMVLAGGDFERAGCTLELNANPKGPRIFFFCCLRGRGRCWKLKRLLMAGDPLGTHNGLDEAGKFVGVLSFGTCGVVMYASSVSSSI